MTVGREKLNQMCWNCRGVFSCIPYLAECLGMYNVNVCALSERWLRTYQLHVLDSIDKNYISIAKGTDERNPELLTCKARFGVAFHISKDIYPFTSLIEVNSDRIIGIEVNVPNSEKYYVFSLYLPTVTQPTSDHHPILCTFETESHLHNPQETSDPTVSWERTRNINCIEDYTFAVSNNLWTVKFPNTALPDVIESYYSCIVSAIKKAEKDTLPYKKFNRHSKPYWNHNLTVLRDSMRSIRNEWINNCQCHDTHCEFFHKYKSAKREFRTALRKAFDEYEYE
ncbi:unnamed protein product [Mytilus coruscus]|uniref:Uncharacterized protein n=1 Tax=Mytilus coruscus TaxID=42192 RepID=A0A6J8E7T5_MYTCO|nr:unnamed protein product [Mytilus coruscus]